MRTRLRPGERKVLETRAHWLTVAVPFLVLLLALAAAVAGYALLDAERAGVRVLRTASLAVLAATALWFLYREVFRRRDIWAVTNFRVIDERGVFTLFSKESPLEKINNLSFFQSLVGRVLRFGSVEIQTAAEDGATVYRMVSDPKRLKDTIAMCRDEFGRTVNPPAAGPKPGPKKPDPRKA
ncbi:MAG: PH domain-containing protein [Candidatus Aminicenantes bacterium]|nr:PH domain-containing protein [Candidatus Aminicenantes bacterium]